MNVSAATNAMQLAITNATMNETTDAAIEVAHGLKIAVMDATMTAINATTNAMSATIITRPPTNQTEPQNRHSAKK